MKYTPKYTTRIKRQLKATSINSEILRRFSGSGSVTLQDGANRSKISLFRGCLKLLEKRGYNMNHFKEVVDMLLDGKPLPPKYRDHPLRGDKRGYRDCHIKGDWVLIYKIDNNILTLILSETGTHSDILE